MTDNDSSPSFGLALSGGAMLGSAHVGALRVLEEEGIRASWVAGTSAGAIVAALYAFGKTCDEMESRSEEMSWLSVANIRPSRLGLLSNGRLADYMRDALGDVKLEDAELPLAVVATDILSGEKQVLREGDLAEAVAASACIPGIFSPIEWGDMMLVDGGISENLPLDTVRSMGAERVIGVDLFTAGTYPEPKSIIDVILNASSILVKNTRQAEAGENEVLIRPKLEGYSAADSSRVSELVEEGYAAARERIEDIRKLVG